MLIFKVVIKKNISLNILSSILKSISVIHRIMLTAYCEKELKEKSILCAENDYIYKDVNDPFDLRLESVSKGSFSFNFSANSDTGGVLSKLAEWLITLIDPRKRKKEKLKTQILDDHEKKQKILSNLDIKKRMVLDDLEIKAAKVELVKKVFELHPPIEQAFGKETANNCIKQLVTEIDSLSQIQERTNAIDKIELYEKRND